MTRSILPSLAIAVVMSTGAAAPAASGEAFQIISAGKSTVTPNRRGQSLAGSEVKKKQKPKYYEMHLDRAKIAPWSPQASKQKHKGEIEIYSISPGANPSARPSKKRQLQAR